MSEVLITLVIIGIIAAIAIPNLVTSYQKKQTTIRLKKVFSEITQAVKLAEVTYGSMYNWRQDNALSVQERADKYLFPFIKMSEKKVEDVKKDGIKFYSLNGQEETSYNAVSNDSKCTTMISGVQLYASNSEYNPEKPFGMTFIVDINGAKKPNKFGRDLFVIYVGEKGIFGHHKDDSQSYPVQKTRDELLNGPSSENYQCNKQGRGIWCSQLIMTDGWEIKDDYPW